MEQRQVAASKSRMVTSLPSSNGAKTLDLRCVFPPSTGRFRVKARLESKNKKGFPISFMIDFLGTHVSSASRSVPPTPAYTLFGLHIYIAYYVCVCVCVCVCVGGWVIWVGDITARVHTNIGKYWKNC